MRISPLCHLPDNPKVSYFLISLTIFENSQIADIYEKTTEFLLCDIEKNKVIILCSVGKINSIYQKSNSSASFLSRRAGQIFFELLARLTSFSILYTKLDKKIKSVARRTCHVKLLFVLVQDAIHFSGFVYDPKIESKPFIIDATLQ